jgi:uncharacterized membrane protein YhfC
VILAAHVGLTLLVWRAVTERRVGWWALAVGLHAAMDLAAFVLPDLVPGTDWAMLVLAVPLAGWALATVAAEVRGAPGRALAST